MVLDISLVIYKPDLDDLKRTLSSLARCTTEFGRLRLLVSGPSSLHRTIGGLLVESGLEEQASMTCRFDNLGFASGHNLLIGESFANGAEFCLILNPDVQVEPGALSSLCASVETASEPALWAPALRRIESGASSMKSDVVDSLGISWSATGRHYDIAQGDTMPPLNGELQEVQGVTGACMLVSQDAFDAICRLTGYFFDDLFLAYREDAELCIRASVVGVTSKIIMIKGFAHVRSVRGFQRGKRIPDLLGVRNRFLIRFRLGGHRPGNAVLAQLRDLLVIVGVVLRERSSLPGLMEAVSIRRFTRFSSVVRNKEVH